MVRCFLLFCLSFLLTSCGFQLQGAVTLAPPLHRLYLQTSDPYGQLASYLHNYLKMSHVTVVDKPEDATTILAIVNESTTEELLGVSTTQQTRQYRLTLTVHFEILAKNGLTLVPVQALSETKAITIQADQILGMSNESSLYYQQMRRAIAYAMMNRIASHDVTAMINDGLALKPIVIPPAKGKHRREIKLRTT